MTNGNDYHDFFDSQMTNRSYKHPISMLSLTNEDKLHLKVYETEYLVGSEYLNIGKRLYEGELKTVYVVFFLCYRP